MVQQDTLADFFKTDFPLNTDGVTELLNAFETKEFKKNSVIFEAGKVENNLRFLEKGIIREYYATSEKEININFYTTPEFITDFSSFNSDSITQKNQECLSDVKLKVLKKDIFVKLLKKYQCGKTFIDITFQRLLEKKEAFEYNRITKNPEELYRELLANKANWLQEVPQYHIASYLGITPETLSRIRKRI